MDQAGRNAKDVDLSGRIGSTIYWIYLDIYIYTYICIYIYIYTYIYIYIHINGWMDGWMDGWMGGTRPLRPGVTVPPATKVGVQGPHTGYASQAATNSPMPGQTHEAHSLDSSGSSKATTCDGTSSGVHTSFLHSRPTL